MPPAELFPFLLPVSLVLIGALVTLGFEPFLQRGTKHALLPWLGVAFLLAAAGVQLGAVNGQLHGILAMDTPRLWMCIAIIASSALAMSGLQQSLGRDEYPGGEAYPLILFATSGAMLLVMACDTLAQFAALELMSLSIYALVGLRRHRAESNEALFKYLVMGAVFSAIFIYGAALTYGATGSTAVGQPWHTGRENLFLFGQVLLIIALLFKIGAVPFHFWTPDAYTGAPVAVTGYMGAVVKVAGFAVLGGLWLNLVGLASATHAHGVLDLGAPVVLDEQGNALLKSFSLVFLVLGLISVVLGNFSALRQTSVRRLIAYSSIAHAGYMLLAFALPGSGLFQLSSLWYYVTAYALATAGALAALAALSGPEDGNDSFSGLAGQGRAQPFYGAVLTIFLVSIAGVPPTIGFLGKYLIFQDLVMKGDVRIAVFAMVMAVVGAAYYFRVIVCLWASPTKEAAKAGSPTLAYGTLATAALATVVLIAWPGTLIAQKPAMAKADNEAPVAAPAEHHVLPVIHGEAIHREASATH